MWGCILLERIRYISPKGREQWWGNVPPTIIPPILFLVWLGALVCLLIFHSQANAVHLKGNRCISRHPGEGRGPEALENTGFRSSPE